MKLLRKITYPPLSSYDNFYEKYKFKILWRTLAFLNIFFLILSLGHCFSGNDSLITTSLAFIMSAISLISLKTTRRYELAVLIVFIMGTAINQYTIYTALNVERIVDLLWMIAISVFLFYMLGSKYGIASIVINFLGVIGAIFYVPKEAIIKTIQHQTVGIEIAHVINIIVATVITSYFIKKLIEYSNYTDNKLKEANLDLLQQRDEKIVMLQEIHHRVKNNLQIVSSLLRLQSSQFKNDEMVEQFQEAVNRVSSMALIHEKMYQTDDLSNVDIKNYLESLIQDILRSYSFRTDISFNIESNINNFSLDSLVPLALIFNELITNSVKHAFKGKEKGFISIVIHKEDRNFTTITYRDNGIGFKKNIEENFGSVLIETFAEQLDGEYKITSDNGIEYLFTFKDLK